MENQSLHQSSREVGSSFEKEESRNSSSMSRHSLDKETGLPACRVCQCAESDKRGVAALGFLGISPPAQEAYSGNGVTKLDCHESVSRATAVVEFISPKGEVFVCSDDIEMGSYDEKQDSLNELGCACKSDLALVHYACALKWFVNHGSTICEICACVAKNIRISDFKKVVSSLKEYEALKERTANGEPNPAPVLENSSVDPDAIAAIRRQRLSEIALWFNPYTNNYSTLVVSEPPSASNIATEEEALPTENTATRWAVEGTGILLATGLLTVTLAWLIAPHVGKKTAKNGLHVLLGGVCALTVVVFFRFFVLTRIKYGPARYWAILFVFWFLVFGIWASRTHGAHAT